MEKGLEKSTDGDKLGLIEITIAEKDKDGYINPTRCR